MSCTKIEGCKKHTNMNFVRMFCGKKDGHRTCTKYELYNGIVRKIEEIG